MNSNIKHPGEFTVWTEAMIVDRLTNDREVFQKAIVTLFDKGQTADEQSDEDTKHRNHVGFSAADAKRLSFLANFIKGGGYLKSETITRYLPRVVKYRKQLVALANEASKAKAERRAAKALAMAA